MWCGSDFWRTESDTERHHLSALCRPHLSRGWSPNTLMPPVATGGHEEDGVAGGARLTHPKVCMQNTSWGISPLNHFTAETPLVPKLSKRARRHGETAPYCLPEVGALLEACTLYFISLPHQPCQTGGGWGPICAGRSQSSEWMGAAATLQGRSPPYTRGSPGRRLAEMGSPGRCGARLLGFDSQAPVGSG